MSQETREKMSLAKIGDKNPSKRLDVRNKISKARKGKKSNSPENCFKKGYKPWNYAGQSKEARNWTKNKRNRVIKRLKSINSCHSFGEWELLKKQYGYTCPCCKKSEPNIKLTEDHIIPLCKGGSDLIENIQPLCLNCNIRKHTKIIKY